MATATWIDATRKELTSTDEWTVLMGAIYEHVQGRLKDGKTKCFADLTTDERVLVMAQVEVELIHHQAYGAFLKRLTQTMDAQLAVHVDAAFAQPANKLTKQSLAMESAAKAASTLVQGLPVEHRSMLRLLFNQPFPPSFRPQAWRLFLTDPAIRFQYETKCAVNRISTISVLDAQFTQRCQAVLDAFPAFPPSRSTVMATKTALSYIHTTMPDAFTSMGDAYFALILPLLLVWQELDASALVEAYSVLLALPRPRSIDEAIVSRVIARLNSIDTSYAEALVSLFPLESPPLASWTTLLQPHVERLFVGVTAPETLLFIWDQLFLVGHDRMLPELCAAILTILQPQWISSASFAAAVATVTSLSATIEVWQLQEWIDQHAAASIRADLQLESLSTDFDTTISSPTPRVQSVQGVEVQPPTIPVVAPMSSRQSPPRSPRRVPPPADSPPRSPRREAPPDVPLALDNAFAPFVDDLHSSLHALFVGDTADVGEVQRQSDDLERSARAGANGFVRHVETFRDALASVFFENSPGIRSAATAEETLHAELVLQCQKAVFGRMYTPTEVRDLTGKAKAAYDKKYPKYVTTYTQKLAKARK